MDKHELGKGMAQIGSPVSAEELDEIMALCDKDGDGSCDYTEFAQVRGAKFSHSCCVLFLELI